VRKCEQQHPRIPRKAAGWIQPVVRRMLGWPIETNALSTPPSAQPRACARAGTLRVGVPPYHVHVSTHRMDYCAGLRHSASATTCLARLVRGGIRSAPRASMSYGGIAQLLFEEDCIAGLPASRTFSSNIKELRYLTCTGPPRIPPSSIDNGAARI
jgi:hypothetical protein